MVLAERNTTDVVRNGRRSRGPSPNTHTSGGGGAGSGGGGLGNQSAGVGSGGGSGGGGGNSTNASGNEKAAATTAPGAGTPESSDDDNSTKRNGKSKAKQSEYEEKIRVGRDYQAVCPPLVPEVERRPEQMNERALLVWSPTKEIPDLKLEEYISVAKEKYGYNGEQALGMLFWHKHDLERAVLDLANFTPFPDEWTIEDKVLFEQAFQFHGKSFHRIRQMLPDKSIASLVKYYYSWKKTRHRSSAMDRQEKAIKASVKDGSENGSEVGSNEESDNDDKKGHNSSNNNNNNNNNSSSNSNINNNNSSNTNISNSNNNNSQVTSNQMITGNSNGDNGNGNGNGNGNMHSSGGNGSGGGNISGGATAGSGGGSGGNGAVGITSSNNNNNNNELDTDQLCIYTNTHGDDILGFGIATDALANGSGDNNNSLICDGNSPNQRRVVGGFCKNCNVVCHILFDSPLGRMCKSCHTHWRRTGNRRPISGPESTTPKRSTHNSAAAADRSKRKPPKGMYINHDDLTALASCKNPREYLSEGDRKIAALMAEIQKNRQLMEQLDKDCESINVDEGATAKAASNTAEGNTITTTAQPRISARWTSDETQVALLALRDYGKNYSMIAKVVTTKTEAHVRTFYVNNRRRFNLDQIVKEYEAAKSEETGAEDHTDAAAATATAAATTAATATPVIVESGAIPVTVGGVDLASGGDKKSLVNDVSESSSNSAQELPVKKDEQKKKPELTVASASSSPSTTSNSSNSVTTGAAAAVTADNGSSLATSSPPTLGTTKPNANNNPPSATATITIMDESDTATNSSSDVATNSTNNAATGGGNGNGNGATSSSSISSVITTPAKSLSSSSHNERESEESSFSLKSSSVGTGSAKRERPAENTADQPPTKIIALSTSSSINNSSSSSSNSNNSSSSAIPTAADVSVSGK